MTLEKKTGFSHESAAMATKRPESRSSFRRFCARVKERVSELITEPAELPLQSHDPIKPVPEKVFRIGLNIEIDEKLAEAPAPDSHYPTMHNLTPIDYTAEFELLAELGLLRAVNKPKGRILFENNDIIVSESCDN
ncbi:MAG: hypothetical protein V1861_00605 [Candidatus Micrarchaeota archaeon]